MPKPLSRIQLLCTRLLAPPAPEAASAPTRIAIEISLVGNVPTLVTIWFVSCHAFELMAANTATTRNTSTAPILRNSSRSTVW